MLRYFAALAGIAALLASDPGSASVLEAWLLPVVFAVCLVIVIGVRGAVLIGIGAWLFTRVDLTSDATFPSLVAPALLGLDLLALVVWAWRRGWLPRARHGPGGLSPGDFWGGDS